VIQAIARKNGRNKTRWLTLNFKFILLCFSDAQILLIQMHLILFFFQSGDAKLPLLTLPT